MVGGEGGVRDIVLKYVMKQSEKKESYLQSLTKLRRVCDGISEPKVNIKDELEPQNIYLLLFFCSIFYFHSRSFFPSRRDTK